MEFLVCPNCRSGYGDIQARCPNCGADHEGGGAEIEFDVTTRAAIGRLGGVFGGILEAGPGRHLVWCRRGVCRVNEETGLVWETAVAGAVDTLVHAGERVRIGTRRGDVWVDFEDGERVFG